MFNTIIKLSRVIGLDKSIAYSSGARVISASLGFLTVFFITFYLTGEEQGYYYTFGSLLAMQVFFELGLTSIITQFVAHEVSHLNISVEGSLSGDLIYKSRLSSLIHFCLKWYSYIGLGVFIFLVFAGIIFFNVFSDNNTDGIDWFIPWLFVCFATVIKFLQSPLSSVYMGLGYVKEMSKIIFFQNILQPLTIWACLFCGIKLYSIGIGYIVSCILFFYFIYRMNLLQVIVEIWNIRITQGINYMREIFPFQWRIALSWISGYFIYNLFNPVLFATEGAIVAGQMGLTISILTAIQSFATSWISTKVPLYSQLIALKDYKKLDSIFDRTNKQMTYICLFILLLFIMILHIFSTLNIEVMGIKISERLLPTIYVIALAVSIFCNVWIAAWGTYLRCHKQEPLLMFSVLSGICCCLSTIGLGYSFGLNGIVLGYTLIMLISVPCVYRIYQNKKEKWHKV